MSKIVVFGIDGASPRYVFDEWLSELPNIKKLMQEGAYAKLNSTVPPSTIIAWNSFASGRDPSEIGVYSYTYRVGNTTRLTNSTCVKCPLIWDILAEKNKKSIVLNVPLTYPARPISGYLLADFLTPKFDGTSTYPAELRDELYGLLGEDYMFDINVGLASYKNVGIQEMVAKTHKMTAQNVKVIEYLLDKEKNWTFLMNVFIGTDRMQHTLWHHHDESHRNFVKNSKFKDALKDYYKFLDAEIGKLITKIRRNDPDATFIIASDHGFDKMEGRINLNDWLVKEGYLVLKQKPEKPVKLDMANVDCSKTRAYAVGAYFGRIFFNKEVVAEKDREKLQTELITKLSEITDDKGNKLETVFHRPQDVYHGRELTDAPDLYAYFDNLIWGVNNDVGNNELHSWATTVGADYGGHAPVGIFIIAGKRVKSKGDLGTIDMLDITPTMLDKMDVDIPRDLRGKVIP